MSRVRPWWRSRRWRRRFWRWWRGGWWRSGLVESARACARARAWWRRWPRRGTAWACDAPRENGEQPSAQQLPPDGRRRRA
eukprot:11205548-Lingulodinium_polyedra.AAC.1